MVKHSLAEKIIMAYFDGCDIAETSRRLGVSALDIQRALRDLLAGRIEKEEESGRNLPLFAAEPAGMVPGSEKTPLRSPAAREISRNLLPDLSPPPREKGFLIRTDGGARHNPGPAAYGVVVYQDGRKLKEWGTYLGIATNNVAEYKGVIAALEHALQEKMGRVIIESDSLLLVRQFKGEYKVKDLKLTPLHMDAKMLAQQVGQVEVRYIPREENRDADAMVNQTLDEKAME